MVHLGVGFFVCLLFFLLLFLFGWGVFCLFSGFIMRPDPVKE